MCSSDLIYGPGRSALLRKFLAGKAVIEGDGTRFINQVHRDDVAAALVLLARRHLEPARNLADTRIYNVSDGHPLSERECYEWLAAHLQKPFPPTGAEPGQRKRGNSNKRVRAAKLCALGWSPRFPDFATGIRESVLPNLTQLGT